MRERLGEHRTNYYKIIEGKDIDETKDDFSLGLHLVNDHGFQSRDCFDNTYEVAIIENCSPYKLEVSEHKNIHKYRTLRPNGINTQNPFAIPLPRWWGLIIVQKLLGFYYIFCYPIF